MDLKNSFEFNTWMIAKLIKSSGTDEVPLYHYVIAVSYKKMIIQMMYRVLKSFCDALKNVPPMFEFPKQFTLISASNSNNKHFIAFLLRIKDHLKLHTPINNLAIVAKHKKDLYNQETYVDFHLILCELLKLLLGSLAELKAIHLRLEGKVPSSTQLRNIMEKIDFIAAVGTLLHLLVKSQAIRKCLYSIIGFLPDKAAGV